MPLGFRPSSFVLRLIGRSPRPRTARPFALARLLDIDRNSALLVLANFIWGIGSGLYVAIWPLFVESLGASPAEVGLSLALVTAISVVVSIPGAALSRHMGRKRAMLLGWAMGPASSIVFALAPSWEHLLPGIVLLALVGLQAPAYLGYIAIAVSARDLARTYSLMTSAVALGTIVSSPIGGRLADLVDMHLLFWGVGAAYLASMVCIFLLDEVGDGDAGTGEDGAVLGAPCSSHGAPRRVGILWGIRGVLAGYAVVFADRRLMGPLAVQLLLLAGANLAQPLAPNWLVGTYDYSLTQIGALGAVAAAASVWWGLILGRVASRRGSSSAVLVAAALVVLGAIAMLGASTLVVGVVAFVLRGAFAALRALSHGLTAALLRPAIEPAIVQAAAEQAAEEQAAAEQAAADQAPEGQAATAGGVIPQARPVHRLDRSRRRPGHVERGFAVYSTLLNAALTLSTLAAGVLYGINPALPFALSAASVLPIAILLWLSAAGSRWGRSVVRSRSFA